MSGLMDGILGGANCQGTDHDIPSEFMWPKINYADPNPPLPLEDNFVLGWKQTCFPDRTGPQTEIVASGVIGVR